ARSVLVTQLRHILCGDGRGCGIALPGAALPSEHAMHRLLHGRCLEAADGGPLSLSQAVSEMAASFELEPPPVPEELVGKRPKVHEPLTAGQAEAAEECLRHGDVEAPRSSHGPRALSPVGVLSSGGAGRDLRPNTGGKSRGDRPGGVRTKSRS
ncbi:unnamed protein product, partial [Polarella glacialis]